MEAAELLGPLQARVAALAGGRDLDGRPLLLVPVPAEAQPWCKEHLDAVLKYFISVFSSETRRNGVCVVVDAQRGAWRLAKTCIRQVTLSLGTDATSILVLRPDAFWDKQRVDNCARSHKEGEPVYLPLSRLHKFVESSQLPEQLDGTWAYDHNQWLQNRIYVEAFTKDAEGAISDLEKLRLRLSGFRLASGARASGVEETLAVNRDMFDATTELAQKVLQAGRELLAQQHSEAQDAQDTRQRVERLLEAMRAKQSAIDALWAAMEKSSLDARELRLLEGGVARVTDWILGPAENMLNAVQEVGFDVASAEELRQEHESLELQCRETYGHYAELLHKVDTLPQSDIALPADLKSQRDFMDFVCRSFATRLERRRNVLITSLRFFRLVSEYFDITSDVFETLVKCDHVDNFETAEATLRELQDSQITTDLLEREAVREGEKLADILCMPVKDALGRDVQVNYECDIVNVHQLLEATRTRRNIFCDSVELQKLTLEQITHVHAYEQDAGQAVQWLDDLFHVMLKAHVHVGCNVFEIQSQKDEHQAFQETAKGTYDYGCQLLNASLALRQSCKLPLEVNSALSQNLWHSWKRLHTVGQEQMTRLRVSAVFHRSVEEHCKQLRELMDAVKAVCQGDDVARRRSRVHKFLASRERLLLEVGRMVRLGRLLRTRLREPLCPEQGSEEGHQNATAVEAISDRLAEVTGLAEQLDASLCGAQHDGAVSPNMKRLLDGTASSSPDDWYSSLKTPPTDDSKSEDEFVTASECTCTPPSRSSSFHTASECGGASPWWEMDPLSDGEPEPVVVTKVTEVTGVLVHEVTETTNMKLSYSPTLGVTSYLLTSETVRAGEGEGAASGSGSDKTTSDKTSSGSDKTGSGSDPEARSATDEELLGQLKESREWLQLKVLDVQPELTHLGTNLQESLELQRAHDEVLQQLQSKQSPVEELLRQADQLISNQRPRAEVYAAMAESLGLAWKDVNTHLEQRKHILDLNVTYQSRADDCTDKMRALEMACHDTILPVEIEAVKQLLTRLHDLKREMLESLMLALQDGKALLEQMKEISTQGTLDSRPDRIKTSASHAVSQVEHWLENLHDRRRVLEITWQGRKTHLEQCLALSLLAKDLRELEEFLAVRKESLTRSSDQLGDSSASAELLLHEHKKLLPEAKDFQDRCLRVTKATEQLVSSGHFAGDQATAQAYTVLNTCAEYLDAIEQREALLSHAISFFRSTHTALTKLDQLEIQLTTTELSTTSPQLAQLHAQATKALEEITTVPLQEGYALLETVGRGAPGAEGVKRTVEEIESRRINLGNLCTAHKEENLHLSQALTTFLEKQNELFSWLVSIAEAFLQGHQDMGSVLAMAKDFLQLHHQLLVDLQVKGEEINEVLLTLPPILEHLNDEQRTDIDEKVDALHSHWLNLKTLLEGRIDLATVYVKFHSLAVDLANEFDSIEGDLKSNPDVIEEDTIRRVEQKWLYIQQLYAQLSNFGKCFIEETNKIEDPYLDIKRASLCVETLLEHFGSRQLVISESWQTWQTSITVEREFKVLWERNMMESTHTADWVSKLDAQLYPILTGDSTVSKTVARELEDKLQIVLPEVRRAQAEIELRIKTTENLALKGDSLGQKEVILSRLTELHSKLNTIATEYQILLQVLISFFKNLAELEKTIENLHSQYRITRLPSAVVEMELLLKEHEASKQAILELFKFTQNESEQIISRINQQEPAEPAKHDVEKVVRMMKIKQLAWESAWTDRKLQLEQHRQLCQFDSDLQQINSTLNDLSKQLSAIQGQYGESLASAKATSLAFVYFEKTIELLQLRIQTFVKTAEEMLSSEHVSSPHIERELNQIQIRWTSFHQQVFESRRLINLSIEYFALVEEAEDWFHEGSKLLVTIARKSTSVKVPEEATQLLNEVELFLKPGEARQDERIRKISSLAIELYGEEKSKQFTLVLNENKEMLDSFTVISEELNNLARNLTAAEEQRERQRKEQEEMDANLAAARAEAVAAQAAAFAAEEARKAAEAVAMALQQVAPIIEKVEVLVPAAIPVPPEPENDMRAGKSPSPPLKKAKFTEELPKPIAPIFTVPLHNAVIQEGEHFTFECRVTGFPVPEVVWHKDGISIQNNPDYQTTYDQGICTLTIEETFAEDSARFTCMARNSAGTAETNATLSVKESEPEEQLTPPIFTKRLEPNTAKEGSTFQLECRVEGNPLPTVQWFKNDVCIDNSPDYAITYNNGDAVLRFEEVFLEDHAEYCCKASNQLGSDACSAKLAVEPLEPTEAPTFVLPLSNIMARAGQKIKLECEVIGLPTPELSWSHNGKPVKETRDLKIQYDDNKATLVITEAFPKDAGTYVVAAKNLAGEATCTCNISVKGRLPTETSDSELASDMEPIKPAIQLSLKDLSVFEGTKVRLDCIIIGQPEPEVIWYHDGRPVKESSDFQLLFQGDRCSLVIQEAYLEDAGAYKVVAINSGGEASSKCNLTVKSIGETEPATRPQVVEVIEIPAGTPPRFSKLLADILAPEGDKVIFECSVSGEPKPEIKWYLNNQEITSVNLKQFNEDAEGNVSLTLLEVSPQDKGVYTVKAINSLGEAKCFANLIVKSMGTPENKNRGIQLEDKQTFPAFKELFADRTVTEKETTKFECIVTGKPTPKVRWYFNNEAVSGKDFLISTSGERQVLIIPEVLKKHSGSKVSCVAENDAGKATCVSILTVQESSDIVDSMMNTEISEHTESSFTMKRSVFMQSSSSQVTSSSAMKGAEPNVEVHNVSSQSEHSLQQVGQKAPVEIQNKKIQEFHQVNHDKPEIRQQSFLKISNGGDDTQESSASSYSTPVSSPRPVRKSVAPRFVTPLNGKIVDQGVDVILEGIVDGYPPPEVSWTKNGQELNSKEGSLSITWELNRARLELKNVAVKDAGHYTCRAVNNVGSANSTADLVVKKTIFPPVFGRRLQAKMAKVGERVVMEVEITGTPDPTVTWFKDEEQILGAVPGGLFRTKIQGNCYALIIEKATLEYSGKYTVKAVNSGGEAQSIADFVVYEPQPKEEVVKHVIFEDITQSRMQNQSQPYTTAKVASEVAPPPRPEVVKPTAHTTDTSTSPILQTPNRLSPFTSESMVVTETTKTEKHMSIKMERTPSPAFQKPADLKPPVTEPLSVPTATPTPAKEVQIPVHIEGKVHTEEVKVSQMQNGLSVAPEEVPSDKQVPDNISVEQENVGIERESITKKSAYEFFINKMKENEDDNSKSKPLKEQIQLPKSEEITKPYSEQTETSKHEYIHFKETEINRPVLSHSLDTKSITLPVHVEKETSQKPSPGLMHREEHSFFAKSETSNEKPVIQPHVSQPTKVTPSSFESVTSKFHSEHLSSTTFEKQVIRNLSHQTSDSLLDEFNLKPEPPPEMGYIPKSDISGKYREDVTTRVKKLEEAHRVLSPIEIPSGGIRIFPAPVRLESQMDEKQKSDTYPEPPKKTPVKLQEEKQKIVHEEPIVKKEVVEEFCVQKKVQIPGTDDRSFQHMKVLSAQNSVPPSGINAPSTKSWQQYKTSELTVTLPQNEFLEKPVPKLSETLPDHPVLQPELPVETESKPQEPYKPTPSPLILSQSESATNPVETKPEVPTQQIVKSWEPYNPPEPALVNPQQPVNEVPIKKLWMPHPLPEPMTTKPTVNLMRPISPRPSAESIAMEKQWVPSNIKMPKSELTTSHTASYSSQQTIETIRSTSPRPSAEGLAMEKLWTPQKPLESEPTICTSTVGPCHFEKDMSPKPSVEGLAMDKIWAHKHPDSALKKAWPPPQSAGEKAVVPWSMKGNIEKIWPPVESTVQEQVKESLQNVEVVKQVVQTQPQGVSFVKHVEPPKVEPTPAVVRREIVNEAQVVTKPFKSCVEITPQSPLPPENVKHYVAEARVTHSSSMSDSEIICTNISTTMEHTTHTEKSLKECSPPVVEENILKPSEAIKSWPPGMKDGYEFKAPPVVKFQSKKEPPLKSVPAQEVKLEHVLEPGPPPEIGFAHPPVERRQSYVEAIEQDLEKDLEKEPTRHLVGAVRTMPPPPQKDKSIPPPLPPKEKAVPPPLPPKDKSLETKMEAKSTSSIKVTAMKFDIKEKPFERFPDLEPFPFKPDGPRPKPEKCPPPPKPSKFIKGEFGGSDYESDFEFIQIPPKWRPYESDTEEFGYRKVRPPSFLQPKRPKSTEPEPLPPTKFDKPPQFDGPPRPVINEVKMSKQQTKTDTTKRVNSKIEVKSEKVKKHHTSEPRKKYSPPALKPGSPPIFVNSPTTPPAVQESNPELVTSPVKVKPDSPKSKTKSVRGELPESGYMADTDEPRHLRQSFHKSVNVKHEESTKTTMEHTTLITEQFSQQSSQLMQQQQHIEQKITPPTKSHPITKSHHRHSEKKMTVVTSGGTSSKPKKEMVSSTIPKQVPVITNQVPKDERESSLEPFPFKLDPPRPAGKRTLGPPPPSPSKFVKGEFRESDYESDYEGRIPPRWRPIDSDADEPTYKSVRPVLTPGGSRLHSRASIEARTPTPPTEFDNPPQFGGPPRPKFEPIEKPAPSVKLEEILKPTSKPQKVFKPKPVTPRSVPPMDIIVATPAVKETQTILLEPGSPPELGFAPPPQLGIPKAVPPFHNATQMETSKVMKFAESTEHSHRVVSVQQTTRVIKFGENEKKKELEPFPSKPKPEHPRRSSVPPPTTPKKFIPGEFRESDYESDYETMRIKAKWAPGDSDTEELQFRRVHPPQVIRSTSVPVKSSVRVPTPMEFDTQPPLLPSSSPIIPSPAAEESKHTQVKTLQYEAEQRRLHRVEEMRKRFGETTSTSVQPKRLSLPSQTQSPTSEPGMTLQPGEPPQMCFAGGRIPTTASYVASKHMNEMTSSFKSKAQQFVSDIMTDVNSPRQNTKPEKPILKPVISQEGDGSEPQAYREESRVSEFGTKHIDPDTGLIYFKYDFGYEFGIVLPGEGKTQGAGSTSKRPRIEPKNNDDIEVKVIHETSDLNPQTSQSAGKVAKDLQGIPTSEKVPQFRPKKFTHFKSVKWEPASESEMSEAEGDSMKHKKRHSLPQPTDAMLQKEPHISIPPSTRWDQASPSPLSLSLSPSLPSLSPRYGSLGPQSNTPVQESTASPGGAWVGLSPNKSSRIPHGRGNTPTPPSTPSTPGNTPVPGVQQLRKPPTFITPLRDIAVVSGQTARFECIVQAEPPPNILWSKNGRIIENSQDYQIQYRNGVCRLTIPQAFPEDAGIYTCTATNMLGTIGTSGSLQVPGERRSVYK